MKKIRFFGMLMALMMPLLVFNACGDDDDVDLDYLVGKWKSYKLVAKVNGESETVNIEGDEELSVYYYMELEFKSNGTVVAGSYEYDDESHDYEWVTEEFQYSIERNVVKVYTEEETIKLKGDDDLIYIEYSEQNDEYGSASLRLYFKKK